MRKVPKFRQTSEFASCVKLRSRLLQGVCVPLKDAGHGFPSMLYENSHDRTVTNSQQLERGTPF